MLESLFMNERKSLGGIIEVDGFNGNEYDLYKTSGVQIYEDRIELSNDPTGDYLMIPNAGTPQPTFHDCEIILDFSYSRFITGSEFVPIGHWRSSAPIGEWALCYNSSSGFKIADSAYSGNLTRRLISGVISPNTRSVFKYRHQNGVRSFYLNDTLLNTVTGNKYQVNVPWYIGSYFNQGTPIFALNNNDRVEWTIYYLSIKYL